MGYKLDKSQYNQILKMFSTKYYMATEDDVLNYINAEYGLIYPVSYLLVA